MIHSVTSRPCERRVGTPCCMCSAGSVSVLICSGGPVHSFGRIPPHSPDCCVRPATARPGQPSLHHLAVCPRWVLKGRETKRALNTSTYRHTHIHDRSEWQWLLFTQPSLTLLSSSPSSLSCCVSLPTNVSATMGQWLILVCLAKCLQDVCLGCLFPPPLPRVSWSRGSRVASSVSPPHTHIQTCTLPFPLAPRPTLSQPPLTIFWEAGVAHHHHRGTKATWTDRDLLFWPEPLFCHSTPSTTTSMRCLFSVCRWSMMGEVLTQHWGAVTLHCQPGWLAYHSPHWEEIHHHSRQGIPSLEPVPCLL